LWLREKLRVEAIELMIILPSKLQGVLNDCATKIRDEIDRFVIAKLGDTSYFVRCSRASTPNEAAPLESAKFSMGTGCTVKSGCLTKIVIPVVVGSSPISHPI
jgi:hypothetical protein